MMFSLTLENPDMVRILKALKERVGLFPIEVGEDGIQLATMDDGRNMAIWVHFPPDMMKDFDFGGDGVERYVVPSETFTKAIGSVSYPIEIGSLMDGSLKINSANGRQTFKLIPERDDNPEESGYHRNRFATIIEEEEHTKVAVLKQDLLEAVRTAKVGGEQVKITLEERALLLSTVDATIEADGVAPLVEGIGNVTWSHSYNIKLLEYFLSILSQNLQIDMYLLTESDSILVHIPISESGFCKMAIAAIPERG